MTKITARKTEKKGRFSQNKTVFLPLLTATHANMPESTRTVTSVEDMGVGASVKRGAESVPRLLRLRDLTANKAEKPQKL